MNDFKRHFELWNKQDEFTDEEISFLKDHIKAKKYKVNYGFYNKESSQNKQIAVVFDLIPFQSRRTGVENNWTIISSRDITDIEIIEFINHYFKKSYKRFLVFYYKNIERLIEDDNKLGAITPTEFIKNCKDKGYSGNYQLQMQF